MTSIGGVDLGEVTNESPTKSSNLFNQPLPYSDSDASLLMDLFGTSKIITVEGYLTGTNAALDTFVTNIENLQNGNQAGMEFVSSWRATNITCLIQDFSAPKAQADENRVTYTLTLVQGTAL